MNDRNIREETPLVISGGGSRLNERPERRNRRSGVAVLLVLCGGLIILGGAGVLAWQLTLSTRTPVVYASTPVSSDSAGKQPAGCTSVRHPIDTVQQQTAQGLHLTVAQVQARVLAGKTIAQVAAEQGLTAAQLHDVEVGALQAANDRWLRMGCITQQDVQDNMRRDVGDASFMNAEFTDWFKK